MANITDQVSKLRATLESKRLMHLNALKDIEASISALSVIEKSKHIQDDDSNKKISRLPLLPKVTVKQRMLNAIDKMPEKFTRKELHETVNNDSADSTVNENTFSVFFSRFIKLGVVRLAEKGSGQTASVYTKVK